MFSHMKSVYRYLVGALPCLLIGKGAAISHALNVQVLFSYVQVYYSVLVWQQTDLPS